MKQPESQDLYDLDAHSQVGLVAANISLVSCLVLFLLDNIYIIVIGVAAWWFAFGSFTSLVIGLKKKSMARSDLDKKGGDNYGQ